jgi:hypothetical protein
MRRKDNEEDNEEDMEVLGAMCYASKERVSLYVRGARFVAN